MADSKRWVVTLREGVGPAALRRRLAEAGLDVDQVLEEIGVVTGQGDDSVADKLRGLDEVEDVSAEGEARIAPPDSDLW
jgi:hypothetical protein